MKALPSDAAPLEPATPEGVETINLPDTDRLAAAVNALPTGQYSLGQKSLAVYRDPASSIGPAHVDLHLEDGENKLALVIACPEKGGPKLCRIVLWKGGNWDIALLTNMDGWTPHNHGITQAQVDQFTASIEALGKEIPTDRSLPDVAKQIKGGANEILGS